MAKVIVFEKNGEVRLATLIDDKKGSVQGKLYGHCSMSRRTDKMCTKRNRWLLQGNSTTVLVSQCRGQVGINYRSCPRMTSIYLPPTFINLEYGW